MGNQGLRLTSCAFALERTSDVTRGDVQKRSLNCIVRASEDSLRCLMIFVRA